MRAPINPRPVRGAAELHACARCMELAAAGKDVSILILDLRLSPEIYPWTRVEALVRQYLALDSPATPEQDQDLPACTLRLSPQPTGLSTTVVHSSPVAPEFV